MVADRFLRTSLLLGEEGLRNLQNSTVMIIGVGAVGGYALEAIARSGVGHLILVDFDVFDETNINRQILALSSTVGRKKIEVAKDRVADINPDCLVEVFDTFVNSQTLPELLSHRVDFVVDAIDSPNPKCSLIEALCKANIPFISSMGAALKSDPSYIHTGRLSETRNCGLAKFIRKRLRKDGFELNQVRCVYSDEPVELPDSAIIRPEAETSKTLTPQRNVLGSMPTITAIFGLTIANYVIKALSQSIISKN